MLGFTKRVRKGNFLDIFFKNYIPRIYRSVERLNIRYLSSEENNIRRSDQEGEIYKEGRILGKMKEDGEKIRVKVSVRKSKRSKKIDKREKRREERKGKEEV